MFETKTESKARGPRPKRRLIRNPHDAEIVAAEWMRWMGFTDAEVSPVGPDEGIDVISPTAVAQVKMKGAPTPIEDIQRHFGVATAARKKRSLFFSLGGYTAQAERWATKNGIALFGFDLQGVPEPQNDLPRGLFSGEG